MKSRMTIVEALDEKDLLVKKIRSKIGKLQPVALIGDNEELTWGKKRPKGDFCVQAESGMQQIQDMIERYDHLNMAVALSNSETFIDTSRGRMSISCAVALRSRLRGSGPHGEDTVFEEQLAEHLTGCYESREEELRRIGGAAGQGTLRRKKSARNIVMIQNPEMSRLPSEKGQRRMPVEEKLSLLDPLDARQKAADLVEKRMDFLSELETKIKIANATTWIEV